MVTKELTVGQLAARSGVAVTALHFYEAKGLIKSQRNAGNQRRYPREVLRRVAGAEAMMAFMPDRVGAARIANCCPLK